MPELHRIIDEGITTFKMFMAYPGVFLVDDATMFRAMAAAGERGGLICMHAENGIVINEMIKRALAQGRTAPKYHALTRPTRAEAEGVAPCHCALRRWPKPPSTSCISRAPTRSNRFAKRATVGFRRSPKRARSILFLSYDNYEEPDFDGAKYVMTPPLREKWNQAELWKGLRTDDLQVISTDHCPFCMKEQKELGRDDFSKIPNGAPGVEHRVSLIYQRRRG